MNSLYENLIEGISYIHRFFTTIHHFFSPKVAGVYKTPAFSMKVVGLYLTFLAGQAIK
jgi:hypothetical protein